jgi:transcriptional regulator with XRE-family HTH domain
MTSPEAQRRSALAEFLRGRRAGLAPATVGLPAGVRRRTPGLRREEVAQLANIGTAWYTALEQGRDVRPSLGVLESLADALRLTADERRHLFLLAGHVLPVQPSAEAETASPAVRRLLDDLDPDPACVLGRCWDYLYWNRAAAAVFALTDAPPPYPRNFVWRLFVDARARRPGWEEVARTVLAQFRAASARYPGDPRFAALIGDLERASPEFRAWWPRHDVQGNLDCRKEILHPLMGHLVLDRTTLQLPAAPDLTLMVYTPAPDTDTGSKLQRLLAMSVVQREMRPDDHAREEHR